MEEKKEIKESNVEITEKPKTVQMNPNQNKEPQIPKSVEEELDSMTKNKLREVAGQLYYQNQQLMNRINNMDMTNIFRRLDYLFKVVENADKFPNDFIEMVTNEICSGIYPEETKEQ